MTTPVPTGLPTPGGAPYFTASEGSRLVTAVGPRPVPSTGRRRVPTGSCHAVAWWSPAQTLCGLPTERMAQWPESDFTSQRVQVCLPCREAAAYTPGEPRTPEQRDARAL